MGCGRRDVRTGMEAMGMVVIVVGEKRRWDVAWAAEYFCETRVARWGGGGDGDGDGDIVLWAGCAWKGEGWGCGAGRGGVGGRGARVVLMATLSCEDSVWEGMVRGRRVARKVVVGMHLAVGCRGARVSSSTYRMLPTTKEVPILWPNAN